MLVTPHADRYGIGTVLIVEDEVMVSVIIEDFLLDLGASEVIACSNAVDAEALVRERTVHCAILDVKVGQDDSFNLADELARREVPFFFATAAGPEVIAERHRHRPILAKPFSNAQLLEFLHAAMLEREDPF